MGRYCGLCSFLEDAVKKYIVENGITDVSSIALNLESSRVILEGKEPKFYYKYKKKYTLRQTDKLVEEFFSELHPAYLDYYRMRKNDGIFTFDCNSYSFPYSSFDGEKRVIYIPLIFTISDSYSIVHELVHDINLPNSYFMSTGCIFFTECLSFLCEMLYCDFLAKKNIRECLEENSRNLYFLRKRALSINFCLRLVKCYLENGYLSDKMIFDIVKSYSAYECEFDDILYSIFDSEGLSIEENSSYILSGLVAFYMYDRIKKNDKFLLEFFELNEVLDDYSVSDVLGYLGLDFDGNNLTSDAYKCLSKKYISYLKR